MMDYYTKSSRVETRPRPRWPGVLPLVIMICGLAYIYQPYLLRICPGVELSPSLNDEVKAILAEVPLIDGHNDWAIWMRVFHNNSLKNVTDISEIDGQVDLQRLADGRSGGQIWSVYVECPNMSDESRLAAKGKFPDSLYWERIHDTMQQIDFISRMMRKFPDRFTPALTASDARRIHARNPLQIASFLSIEGLHQIGNSPSILRQYYDLGVRYATLTHDCHNHFADSTEPITELHGGLSKAGRQIVHEMNRMGMVIDLSHTSANTMRDALAASRAPVIFSHSSAYGVCPHRRNVPDDVLDMIKANNGLVMVTFYPEYTRCEDPGMANLTDVALHMEYIGQRIGYDHVGIGSDFDGMARGVLGLEDISRYPALILELLGRGMRKADIKKVIGLNVLRVLEGTESIKHAMQTDIPLEDGDVL